MVTKQHSQGFYPFGVLLRDVMFFADVIFDIEEIK